jgi:hypothetical protein
MGPDWIGAAATKRIGKGVLRIRIGPELLCFSAIRSPASNSDAIATRARLNMLPPIGFSNHRPILMQWSIVQIENGPGATGTGIVCNPATEGWLAGPETLTEIARIQRWKDSEKANCF